MAIRSNLEKLLMNMETKAEDELSFLLSTGPEYFTTAQLIRLKGQWEVKNRLFHQLHRIILRIGALAPAWLLLWLICSGLKIPYLGLLFLFFFPFSLLTFLGGMVLLRYLFSGKGHLDLVGKLIQEELGKRRRSAGKA
jgi:hypothetical protein